MNILLIYGLTNLDVLLIIKIVAEFDALLKAVIGAGYHIIQMTTLGEDFI